MDIPYIDIHTHRDYTETDVISINSYIIGHDTKIPNGNFCAGIHPWYYKEVSESSFLDFFKRRPSNLIAVGEIGLDFGMKEFDKTEQMAVFSKQVDSAIQLQMPIIVHCVKGYNELETALRGRYPKSVILHGFKGSPDLASNFLDKGYYLSFGANTFASPKTLNTLRNTPISRIFLETDVADVDIRELYLKTAHVLNIELETLKERILTNYKNIFGDE